MYSLFLRLLDGNDTKKDGDNEIRNLKILASVWTISKNMYFSLFKLRA